MVNVVNSINNKVSTAMIDSEPDLSKLASSLSSVIPASAQSLAGINAKTATANANASQAKTDAAGATAAAPKAASAVIAAMKAKNINNIGIQSAQQCVHNLSNLNEAAEKLAITTTLENNNIEQVIIRTPTEIAPNTKECTKLFNKPSTASPILSLSPGGDLPVALGASETVQISGGQAPYSSTFLCDCYGKGVTATLKVAEGKTSITVHAPDKMPSPNYFPLMVTDATGVGRPLNIVVVDKKAEADTPDCGK
jgi:hypothetical protein